MILTGRKISQGKSHGRILLCPNPVSFLGGVNPADGKVADASTNGQSAKDRVFAFPRGKGSTVGSYVIYDMKEHGTLPAAIINESAEPIVATGAVMASVPMVDSIDLSLLREGDECIVDGSSGTIELPDVKEINVVSCVIKDGERILFLRRSSKVGTFQGYWSAVSGFIEADETPLETAIKEVREETTIVSKPTKVGEPFKVRDKDIVWTIHPFLFEEKNCSIQIDWEHTEYKWVCVDETVSYQCVPGLDVVYKSLGL